MKNLPILKKNIEDYSGFWVLALYNFVSWGLFLAGFLLLLLPALPLYFLLIDGASASLEYYLSLTPFFLLGAIFVWRGVTGIKDGLRAYFKKDDVFRTKFLTSFLPIALCGVCIFVAICLVVFGIIMEPMPTID